MMDELTLASVRPLVPRLLKERNKYTAGQLLCVGGMPGMEGAMTLATSAAYRSGAGIVKWAVHAVRPGVQPLELVQLPVIHGQVVHLDRELARSQALLLGSGDLIDHSQGEQAPAPWIPALVQRAQDRALPTLFDGGAFRAIQEGWCEPNAGDLLTPHEGELELLMGRSGDRLHLAQELAQRYEVVVIAKGVPTYVVGVGHAPLVWHGGDPGMATAGTGDVLAGLCAGCVAQGMLSWEAAQLATVLHGTAGEMAARRFTSYGMIASDLLEEIPSAWQQLLTL